MRVLDALDGAQGAQTTFSPEASKSPDGRLWFTNDTAGQPLRLPTRTRDIEIDYTALSFRVPQKVRFRYKLEGRNPEWQDAGGRRQVFFSDLPPGPYTFRVIASNNDGVWNETGDSWTFSVARMFYQTLWFRALMALAGLALIWLLYRLRLQQITARADLRYAERLEERTRIARELHDTMLQTFQASLAQMQAGQINEARIPAELSR